MNTATAITKREKHAILAGMGGGYAVGHALVMASPVTGAVVGISAAAAFYIFWRFFEKNRAGMGLPVLVNLRGLAGGLLGLMTGGAILYRIPIVDRSLTAFALILALFFFFQLVKKGDPS